ncbi:MAG: Swt1 family HEPN domain-containing protein [Nitrosopumilus sp.]|nr:Swt1 family HEPN domain-containing protein [Nitrosopumilus sp.]
MNKSSISDKVEFFGMKNLILETELLKLEKNGLEIGHADTIKKEEVVDPELFEIDIRKSAKKMADYYVLYYCLENTIRRMIKDTLFEKHGANWWDTQVPEDVKNSVKEIQNKEQNSVMSVRAIDDPLAYTTLGELIPILEKNWSSFSDLLRSKKGVNQTLSQLNQTRSVIAHSVELNDDEISRMKLLIKDWQRQQS